MTEREQLEQAIEALENQRDVLGDAVVDAAMESMREKLSAIKENLLATQQRKLVTVLFMDIVGSTSISQNLDPEITMTIMDTALQRLSNPVLAHGGRVTRYMGDGFLALFGAPVARENEAEMGVRAGLQILGEAKDYAAEIETQWQISGFSVRVGISTGLVIIGGDSEAENTIMGTTVNLAARLESAAKPGTVLISQLTFNQVRGMFDFKPLEPIKLKGFTNPIKVFQVLQVKPPTIRGLMQSVAGIETNMVGRDPELLSLKNMFQDALEDAEAHVVTVVGDAGVGKSRLMYEFLRWIDQQADKPQLFMGSTTPETEIMPYSLVRSVFANGLEILESDGVTEVQGKLRAGMAGSLNTGQADLVGQLLGFDFSTSQSVQDKLGSESFGELATTHLVGFFRDLTCEPTIIVMEDLHWADDSSLDLLDYLMTKVNDTRLLVICLSRPELFERRPNWGEGRKSHTQVNLKPLSRRASRELVGEILQKADDVPDVLRDLIVEGAEGNPFFVEELIKMLIGDGVIVIGEHTWKIIVELLPQVNVPLTLTGVLQARLDSLPYNEKMLLQRASVVGRLFWGAVVAELASDKVEAGQVNDLLESIRKRELIFRREYSRFEETDEYIFKHALLRDVAYETVLIKRRKIYHKQVAVWLESAAGDRLEEYLGLIAGHYELSGDQDKALEYLRRAGDKARLSYAHQEAVEYYKRELAILNEQGELGQAARTMMKLGLVYHTAFDYQRSRQAYEQGFDLLHRKEEVQPSEQLSIAPHAFRMARANPSTLDPTMAGDSFSGGIINQLFSGLVEGRLAMEVMPDVARSWDLSPDGKKYVFHLRDDVRWSDGVAVTAGDFEYAWKRVLDPAGESPNASLLYDIKNAKAFHQGKMSDSSSLGVRALDNFTLDVELEGPTGYFLSLLAHYVTYPVPRHVLESSDDAWTKKSNIVTNGAFKLEDWMQDETMTLVRNPDYHGNFKGNLERVELLFDVDWSDQIDMYEAGDLDFLSFGGTPLERDQARQRHAGEYVSAPLLGATYLGFDVSRPPFDNPLVRRALTMAVDRTTLANEVLRGYELPAAGGFVPPGMPGHTAGISLPYDPKQARRLLEDAGYPGGQGFPNVDALTWQGIKSRADFLHNQWRENLGIEIAWKVFDFPQFTEKVDRAPVNLLQTVWMPDYPDPDSVLRASPIRRRSHWHNETFDELVEKARRVLDQDERLELYAQSDRILVEEEAVVTPLTYMWTHILVKPWVRKFPASAINEWLWKDFVIEVH